MDDAVSELDRIQKMLDGYTEAIQSYWDKPLDTRIGLILKAHLLIESEILNHLARKTRNPKNFIGKYKGRFSSLLAQAKQAELPYPEWMWEAIDKLNDARIQAAHNLGEGDFELSLKAFVETIDGTFHAPSSRLCDRDILSIACGILVIQATLCNGAGRPRLLNVKIHGENP